MSKKVLKSYKIDIPTAGTRVALSATITAGLLHQIYVRASTANTGLIYVGGPDVAAANGFGLSPGEQRPIEHGSDGLSTMAVDPTGVYFDTATSGNDVEILVLVNG